MTIFYAHSVPGQDMSCGELLVDHLAEVGRLAAGHAEFFGATEWGQAAGLLHDLGKSSAEFQRLLHGEPLKVDHSSAGAREICKRWGQKAGRLLAYGIAGHHAGLADSGELDGRLHKPVPVFEPNLVTLPNRPNRMPVAVHDGFGVSFLARMLFSCLVDADRTATAKFYGQDDSISWPAVSDLQAKLDQHLLKFGKPVTLVQRTRADVLADCRAAAARRPGFFSLTVPTGGGKTLSSLAFALAHAERYGLRRVIYAIPFTSIIEQNAKVFRDALGDNAVLEHHSNYHHPGDDGRREFDDREKLRLAAERWDATLIVTTNVQLFESLFSSEATRCRKLHSLARSVIILDEAQTLPPKFLVPCLAALKELVSNYGATVVLCTATQPALNKSDWFPGGLDVPVTEIVRDATALYASMRRTKVVQLGRRTLDEVAAEVGVHEQALCIVNTRKGAREFFRRLPPDGSARHLSALMYPEHRSRCLDDIRLRLKAGERCLVVSTQLIEAGVDIDFPVVYRARTGIDSIAQAAGRCNREGMKPYGDVFIFTPDWETPRDLWQRQIETARLVLERFPDPLVPDAIRNYFEQFYADCDLDGAAILKECLATPDALDFRTASERFRLIDNRMEDIIIPREADAKEWVNRLRFVESPGGILRLLQRHTVQVYPEECSRLRNAGAIEVVNERFFVLCNLDIYDEMLGLVVDDPTYVNVEHLIV